MEREMNLSEDLRVSDSRIGPVGVVVIRDDEGRIILRKKNMIVGTGRSYVSGLVSGAIAATLSSSTIKISGIKFGTGGSTLPTSSQTALASWESGYDTTLDTTLVWKKSTADITSGASNPGTAVLGDYFYNTTQGKLYEGTTGPVWTEVVGATGTSFPVSPTEDDVFYRTDLSKLYVYSKAFTIASLGGSEIGLALSITIRGITPVQISELGLFLSDGAVVADESVVVGKMYKIKTVGTTNWNTVFGTSGVSYSIGNVGKASAVGSGTGDAYLIDMFSRLAFDPISITTDVDAFNISYNIYF
jgi:hypothetical protein